MKNVLIVFLTLGYLSVWGQESFTNQTDSISYAIGFDIANSIQKGKVPLNADVIQQGISDAFSGEEQGKLAPEIVVQLIKSWQQMAQENAMKEREAIAAKSKAEGEAFLAENASKEGIVVTESGLQYEILEEGAGMQPADSNKVSVHYQGTLLNGTVFDSSYERGEPITFVVKQVISGWTEALQLMKEGSKYRLYIPSDLGYGESGTPNGEIPPHSVLIFEVELLDVL